MKINEWVGSPDKVWTLCYRRSTHGAAASTFHSLCNFKGPTVTVANLNTGRKIGGYAPISWQSANTYTGNSSAFLFSLTNNFRHSCGGQSGCAYFLYDGSNYGPTWGGGHDWYVASDMTTGYCNLGHYYACRVGSGATCHNDFCGAYNGWAITELEVWY